MKYHYRVVAYFVNSVCDKFAGYFLDAGPCCFKRMSLRHDQLAFNSSCVFVILHKPTPNLESKIHRGYPFLFLLLVIEALLFDETTRSLG